MGAPKVNNQEQDYSTRVPSFPGLATSIVLPSRKGTVGEAVLVTSETDLLNYYTPDQTVKVGDDMAIYSALAALQKTDKLWVVRPDNGSLYGGLVIQAATGANSAMSNVLLGNISAVDDTLGVITVTSDLTDNIHIKNRILIKGSTNAGAYTVNAISYDSTSNSTSITVAETIPHTDATGTISLESIVDPSVYGFASKDALFITGKNQGLYNSDIAIKLFTYTNYASVVKEPDAFTIQVYKKSTGVLLETFLCSRDQNAKDGYGNNIYVENAVAGSNYIQVIDNLAVDSSVLLADQPTLLTISGGFDGYAVTDAEMVSAADVFKNKNKIYTTLILDGGHTTPAYQKELVSICEGRMDCVAILSMPFEAQASSDYVNEMLTYRNTTLNVDSSYAALYSSHLLISDAYNDRQIYVSPDGYVASVISATAANFEIWFPPAGFRRGQLQVLNVKRAFSDGELDILYDAGINPIKITGGKGITIDGQKTLSSRPSALDRLNVRLLLITIEPAINSMLEDYLFEFNDDFTRKQISSNISTFMVGTPLAGVAQTHRRRRGTTRHPDQTSRSVGTQSPAQGVGATDVGDVAGGTV